MDKLMSSARDPTQFEVLVDSKDGQIYYHFMGTEVLKECVDLKEYFNNHKFVPFYGKQLTLFD